MSTRHSQSLRLLRKVNAAAINIMIVEDNDSSRRLITELLRAAGFTNLTLARDAEEAIDLMAGMAPDLLIVDWGLPGMTGLDLTLSIRQAAVTPDARFLNPAVPIVMLTGRQSQRDVTLARNAGIDEFVIKPFSTISLLKAICACLLKRRPFIVSAGFIGPCRRRGRDAYHGLLRRADDIEAAAEDHMRKLFHQTVSIELNSLRALVQAKGGLSRRVIDHMVERLMQTEKRASDFRLKLIAQATRSLNDYVELFGDEVEADVLDVHLEALTQLNDAPHDHRPAAISIVRHLDTLVNKRKKSRRAA